MSDGAPVTEQSGELTSEDGVRLFWRGWSPPAARAVVLISHGLGEHGGRYARTARDLAAAGFATRALDHRGHGRSGGVRGHVRRFDAYVRDLARFRETIADEDDALRPMFLLGHSLGGLIALRYLATAAATGLAGAILSAPLLGIHLRAAAWKRRAAGLLSRALPALRLANEIDPAELSHDPLYVTSFAEDSLVHTWVTPRLYTEFHAAIGRAHAERGALRLPLLFLVPGADPVVRADDTLRFVHELAGDVAVRTYDGMHHELLNETCRADVVRDVVAWIEAHLPAALPK